MEPGFALSIKLLVLLARASQSYVLLRTEKNLIGKNWRRKVNCPKGKRGWPGPCTSVFSLLRLVSAAAFRKLASGKFLA